MCLYNVGFSHEFFCQVPNEGFPIKIGRSSDNHTVISSALLIGRKFPQPEARLSETVALLPVS